MSLVDACERSVELFATSAKAKGVDFDFVLAENSNIIAPPVHLDILVRNLIENAVKYSVPKSEIIVSIQSGKTGGKLRVLNRCKVNTIWDESKVFEPFYRPDTSRSSETGGNGLGLALCKAVADANGWKISISCKQENVVAQVEF